MFKRSEQEKNEALTLEPGETSLAQQWALTGLEGKRSASSVTTLGMKLLLQEVSRLGTCWHHLSLILVHRFHTCWSSHFWFIHRRGKVESWRKNSRRLAASWNTLWFSWNILLANKGNHPKVYHKSYTSQLSLRNISHPFYSPFPMSSLWKFDDILQTENI